MIDVIINAINNYFCYGIPKKLRSSGDEHH